MMGFCHQKLNKKQLEETRIFLVLFVCENKWGLGMAQLPFWGPHNHIPDLSGLWTGGHSCIARN
jgi:hypothetical protein